MAEAGSAPMKTEQTSGRRATATRAPKKELSAPASSTRQAVESCQKLGSPAVRSRLQKAISELQGVNEFLLSGDLDPHVLVDFRDALNRVRNAAWAAQQYVASKQTGQDSSSVLSFLVGERIRASSHFCQAISDDLKQSDIEVQAGSLIQLYEVMSVLTKQLKGIVNKLG